MSALGLSHLHEYHPSKTFSRAAIELCIAKMLPSLLDLHEPLPLQELNNHILVFDPKHYQPAWLHYSLAIWALNDLNASENKLLSKEEDLSAFTAFHWYFPNSDNIKKNCNSSQPGPQHRKRAKWPSDGRLGLAVLVKNPGHHLIPPTPKAMYQYASC